MLMILGLIGETKEWLLDKIGFKFSAIEENGETKLTKEEYYPSLTIFFFFYRIMAPYI